MKLDEYLVQSDLSVYEFASESGLSPHLIYRVLKGSGILLETAALIVDATQGKVDWRDMLPLEEKKRRRATYSSKRTPKF